MPPRANIRHVISSVAPPEAEAGDEWWDVGANKYYKYAIVSGSSPQWVEMAQQTVLQTITGTLVTFVNNLLIQPNTWTAKQTFSADAAFTSNTESSSTSIGALTVSGGIGVSGNIRSGGNVFVNNNNSYILKDTTGSNPYLTCQNDNNLVLYSTEGVGVASNVDVNGNYPSGQTKSFLILIWGDTTGVAQIIWYPYSESEYLFRKGQSVIISGEWNPRTSGATTIYTRDQIKASINTTQIVTECGSNYIKFATTLAGSSGAFYYANQISAGGYVENASINTVGGRAVLAIAAKKSLSSLQLLPGGGRVGIGTSSPTAALHVSTSDNPNYAYWTSIKVDGVSNSLGARLLLNNWEIAGMGTNNPPLSGLTFSDTNASATRMSIDSSGRIGIGTTAPTSLLTVNGNAEIGQVLNVGVLPPINWNYGTGYAPFSQLQMWSKRSSTDTLPNQTVRWTWYADSNNSVGIGDRTLQLWAYPYSSAVPSSLAIFDQWLRFQYPTFTETTINLVTGSTGNLTIGGRYIITDLGTMKQKHWNIIAGSNNAAYSVGSWFNASLNPATLAPLFGLNTFSTTTVNSSAWTIAIGEKAVYTAFSNQLLIWIKNTDGTLQSPLLYQISSDTTQIIVYSGYLYFIKYNTDPSAFYRFPINSDGTLGTREDISTTNIYHFGMAINDKGVYLCGGKKNYGGIAKSLEFVPFTNNGSSFGSPSQYGGNDTTFCIIYNNNLYATGYNYIYKYVINSDGTLGTRTDYAILSSTQARAIVAYNNMLYISNYNSTTAVSAFPINSDGTLGTRQDYFTGSLNADNLSIVNSMLIIGYGTTDEFLGMFPINANGTLGTYTTVSTSGQRYNAVVYDVNTNIVYCSGQNTAGSAQQIRTFLSTNGFTGSVISQNYTRKTSIFTDLDLYGTTAAQSISSTYIANTGSNSSGLSILNKNTSGGSGAYSIYMQGNDLHDNRFVIFTNSSARTSDGGAGNTTLRTDYGQLRLSSASNGLYISSGLNFAITSISNTATLNDTHLVVLAGGTTSYTVTLPAGASTNTGRTYYIKKTSTNSYTLTIAPTSPSTIDGATSIAFTAQYMSYTVVSDGANWFVI